ncbi:10547_t:CDS:1, partial [Ambispora gerdemannii]
GLLQMVCSVNLTSEGHYLAFDEALETYGIKFIKQNITRNLTDQQTMMLKIKAVQSKRNRLLMLLAEYTDDVAVSQSARTIKSRKDSLWSLATKLSSAFDYPDPMTHYLFKDAPEICEKGIEDILSFYEHGESRF